MIDADLAWTQYHRFAYSLADKFARRYGGDPDDYRSVAHERFMAAVHSYDSSRAKLITWIGRCIWQGLMESVRVQRKWQRNCQLVRPARSEFSLLQFLGEISSDAAQTVALVLAPSLPARCPASRRNWLAQQLLDMGWTAQRVYESFSEIERNLVP